MPARRLGPSASLGSFRTVLGNPHLRRVALAFAGFGVAEYGIRVAVLIVAYEAGGAAVAGLVGVVQLVPAAAVAPFAAVLADKHRRERVLTAGYLAQAGAMAATAAALAGDAPVAAYALALTVLVVALAKPQATVAVPVERASIMLTTDYSGSMQATDVPPSRLSAARAAAERFLRQVPDAVRVGLVAFNQNARLVETPTTDRAGIRAALAELVDKAVQ